MPQRIEWSDPSICIVIPTLDEAAGIEACLAALQPLRGEGAEVIVVDGGSRDATRTLAAPFADQVIESPRGRAMQMNCGALASRSEVIVFLHADTVLPAGALQAVREGLKRSGRAWGRFDVAIAGSDPFLAVVAFFMNVRSRWTGIATGDQALFVRREAFERAGGYSEIPLMEDVALSRALRRISPPLCLSKRVLTSGRRWEKRGTWRTIVLMWRIRLAYFLGADPRDLARRYGRHGPRA